MTLDEVSKLQRFQGEWKDTQKFAQLTVKVTTRLTSITLANIALMNT